MVLHFIGEIVSKSVQIEKICEFCGSLFTAQKLTTRYCSHLCNSRAYKANIRNSKIEENKNQTALIIEQKPIKELQWKEILTISDTAIFIGVSRPTVYNCLPKEELNSISLGYKTLFAVLTLMHSFLTLNRIKHIQREIANLLLNSIVSKKLWKPLELKSRMYIISIR